MASKRPVGPAASTWARPTSPSTTPASQPSSTTGPRADLARPWTDTFDVLGDDERRTSTGPIRWGAPRGLRSLVEDLAQDLEVERREVADLAELDARAVVLAMPDPQARRLVGDHPVAGVLDREWEPVLALAARWTERAWDLDGAFVNDDPDVAWIADDGRRRGDDAPVLVAHSTPDRARAAPRRPGRGRAGPGRGRTPVARARRARRRPRPPLDVRAPDRRARGAVRPGRRPPARRRVRRRLGPSSEGRDRVGVRDRSRTGAGGAAQRALNPEHRIRRCSILSSPR